MLPSIARRLVVPLALATTVALLVVPAPSAQASVSCRAMHVVAHRGYHHGPTENTLRAFRAAVHKGAEAIETDLRTTRDHRIVLMHDRTLGRTTRARGRIRRMRGAEVHRVRTNDGQRVPYLITALRFLRHHRHVGGVFEMKRMTRKSLHRLRRQIVRTHTGSRITLTSTRRSYLRRAKRLMPGVGRMRIAWQPVVPRRARNYATGVMMPLERLSSRRVRAYRRHGLAIGAMTVDRPRQWRKMSRVGIRTVSTNRVPRFRRFCRRVSA